MRESKRCRVVSRSSMETVAYYTVTDDFCFNLYDVEGRLLGTLSGIGLYNELSKIADDWAVDYKEW